MPGRPSSAASWPRSPRSGRCGPGASRRLGPGRCGRTGSAGPPSWSPTGKRPGSPTRRRRSARLPSGQAQLSEAFHASVLALELPGEQALLRAMGRGQLEAQVSAYQRAAALAPRDVGAERAAADRRCKSDTARAQAAREAGRDAEAETAEILAGMTAEKLAGLRVADAARREWAEAHASEAAQARAAEAELRRRDQPNVPSGPPRLRGNTSCGGEREAEFRARLPQIVAEAEARYAAEAGKAEPEAVWQQPESQAQAEATPERSWEPGEAMADMDFEAEI